MIWNNIWHGFTLFAVALGNPRDYQTVTDGFLQDRAYLQTDAKQVLNGMNQQVSKHAHLQYGQSNHGEQKYTT